MRKNQSSVTILLYSVGNKLTLNNQILLYVKILKLLDIWGIKLSLHIGFRFLHCSAFTKPRNRKMTGANWLI